MFIHRCLEFSLLIYHFFHKNDSLIGNFDDKNKKEALTIISSEQ